MAILVDISGLLHRAAFNSTKSFPPQEEMLDVNLYKKFFIDYCIADLVDSQLKYKNTYGDLIICFDYKGHDSYWRKDIYPAYKGQRKLQKDKSKFDYKDVYQIFDELKEQLVLNTPWKCVTTNRAEADDTILVLARLIGQNEKTLILSADKDMIQAQHLNPKVDQYSPQTRKWLEPEDKYDDMKHWFLEHQCLGDASDNVFNIMKNTEFSESFKNHLVSYNIEEELHVVHKFKEAQLPQKQEILSSFKVYKKQKKSDPEPVLDVYKDIRFGSAGLDKAIIKFGSLENMLESNPIIRENYELNYQLVMEEGIPEEIKEQIILDYNEAKTDYNQDEFRSYLDELGLYQCMSEIQKVFKVTEEISIDNCGW